ncbi:MAG: heme-binding protein, partial [Bacteroidota bacterium]
MSRHALLMLLIVILGGIGLFQACQQEIPKLYEPRVIQLNETAASEAAEQIRQEVAVTLHDDFSLALWASDSLIEDPIAISIDPQGRIFYTSATRQTNSEFDIRGHRNWMTASISFETVEDRRAFLRKTFSEQNEEGERALQDLNDDGILDWRDLTVEKEQVWFITDQSGDGVADQAKLYLEDFHEEVTDVANGIEFHAGEVYIGVGPDMWRTKDRDQDGMADLRESISHGYAVHIGFSGHGMSGAKIGPDGRLWWGIGDIGANVIDRDGKQWK